MSDETKEAVVETEKAIPIQELGVSIDAAIEKLLPPDDEGPSKTRRASDDDDDTFVAEAQKGEEVDEPEEAPEDDDAEDDEAADDGAKAEADKNEPDEGEDDEDIALHRAYTTLHDQGVPTSVLKHTPKAKLIAWARDVEGRSKKPEAGESKGSASRGDPSAQADGDAKSDAKAAGEPARAPKQDWAVTRKAVAEKLGIDEESADALKPFHDDNETLRAEVKELRSLVEQSASDTREREGRAAISENVRRLEGRYPELGKNEKARERLVEEAVVIVQGLRATGKTVDIGKAFDKAATLTLGAPKRGDLAQLRRNGTGSPPSLRGGLGATADDEVDYWAKAYDHAESGRPDLIKRLRPPPLPEKQKRR